jgi:RNA polymerase sigma factor (sigma-70 family)
MAEDVVQEALLNALEAWPRDGLPSSPRAWLFSVARRRAIDRVRRERRWRLRLADLSPPADDEPDNRLELIFTCCHPALAPEAQIALTLRAVCGLTTAEIASAFLVSESTLAQRIVRAQRKIASAGIPYRVPDADELDARVRQVLSVLYVMFNEGYLTSSGGPPARRDIAEEAAWLCELVCSLFPRQPEALGLLALMRLHLARSATRFDRAGELVLLRHQDRSRWDRSAIAAAIALIERAATLKKVGPYQLQAAIAACHAEASSWAATDWPQILVLYDMLLCLEPSPVTRLHRAVALREVAGAQAALDSIRPLAHELDGYHLFWAVAAEFLSELGLHAEAVEAQRHALELTQNRAEQSLLHRRLREQQC